VIIKTLHRSGIRDSHVQALAVGSVALCIGLWIRAKTVDQDERGNAERRAIFVGLWAPTLWGMAGSLRDRGLSDAHLECRPASTSRSIARSAGSRRSGVSSKAE